MQHDPPMRPCVYDVRMTRQFYDAVATNFPITTEIYDDDDGDRCWMTN